MHSNIEKISLNGDFNMAYLGGERYLSEYEPIAESYKIEAAVPAYFEDMADKFRATVIHTSLCYNPLYTLQRYPQAGYVPDMALPNFVGSFAYYKDFYLDELTAEGYELYVGGVQNTLAAWVNGSFIGRHEGYSSDFSIVIPKKLLLKGKNKLTLAVSNNRLSGYMDRPVSGCTSRAANECTGGIYGDVEIRIYRTSLRSARVTVSEDMKILTVTLDEACERDVTVEIRDEGKAIKSAVIYHGENAVTINSEGLRAWTLDDPYRYECALIYEGYETVSLFGLRRLTARGTDIFFNGKPFYVRGICEHGYYPLTVHPPKDKSYFRANIRKIKSLGFNFIRFHTTVPIKEYIEAADEVGILMEIETPNNTTYSEWCDIVKYCSRFTAPVMYSSGNEMVIDEDYIEHLSKCARLVHTTTDSLFSPMSAMRGIEYHSYGDCKVEEPFPHNPERLAQLSEFCDAYNSYTLGLLSYSSERAEKAVIDTRNSIYKKPLLSHEICINGTYVDLSLKDRYKGTRIGDTELFSSVERHLCDKGLLSRAPLYYKNSVEWQRRVRKACFESARSCETVAGYDYLGDVDHHWHTFGYCVGMMNEFYELKPTETVRNVRKYNSDTVILASLPYLPSFRSGERVSIPISVSHYAKRLDSATLSLRIASEDRVYYRKTVRLKDIPEGRLSELYTVDFVMPRSDKAIALKLYATLSGGDTDAENDWELYLFPRVKPISQKALANAGVTVTNDITASELIRKMEMGECVVLFGTGPFSTEPTSFQISLAGRTTGHLATVITDNPITEAFPHEGFCSYQFREMMKGGSAIILDDISLPFEPMIEIATTYKNARREALLFEYGVGRGRLIVCSLKLSESDPGAEYLRSLILNYAAKIDVNPRQSISVGAFRSLLKEKLTLEGANENEAQNKNDITMR